MYFKERGFPMSWEFKPDRPIYTQLLEQIQIRIVTGVYPPGSQLLSVRELAAQAAVNPNTMQKALAELERMELVYTKRTAGRFITGDEGGTVGAFGQDVLRRGGRRWIFERRRDDVWKL
jgi:DNA-binding transcriptional regulator YhcF (GntR family)